MTAEVCLGHCGAYQYYGTQYSTESDSSSAMTTEYSNETCAGLCSGLSGYYGTQYSEERSGIQSVYVIRHLQGL
ncbi:expressed unknown protein [Ectocarpus siliculosus]|uniref:WSC domain-containing protein n=1 Tax=Ectocarpus siliculosus TaxID=2880 RepID=D7FX02_ECTSI|nr:expressed unknown protein [Ectocarpus siliculosus]|eukprot:CBJ26335.1 expressed unknown protein [Ectocarpus siliculosus]